MGEHFRTHYQVSSWFKKNALNIFQPDIGRTGFSNAFKQLKMANESKIQVTPHMGMGSPVFQGATLHFSSICENDYLQEYQAGLAKNLNELVKTFWEYDKGYIKMPQKPGLGVEIDEKNILKNSVNI